jgi:hypothetical protein
MTREKVYEMKNYGRRRCSFVSDRKPRKQSAGMTCPYGTNEGGRVTEESVAMVTTRQTCNESYMEDPVLEDGDWKW